MPSNAETRIRWLEEQLERALTRIEFLTERLTEAEQRLRELRAA